MLDKSQRKKLVEKIEDSAILFHLKSQFQIEGNPKCK